MTMLGMSIALCMGETRWNGLTRTATSVFSIRTAVQSNKFTFSSNRTRIEAWANAEDEAGNIYSGEEINYSVELRTATLGVAVCSGSGTTTGDDVLITTNKLAVGKKYYIRVYVDDDTTGMYRVVGEGFATNVDEVF